MTETERPAVWRRLVGNLASKLSPLLPSLGWLYVALSTYVFIGSSVFPGWWRRFLLARGFLDLRFWAVAFGYFEEALRSGHPVGLVTVALAVVASGWILFMVGRVGLHGVVASVRPPRRSVIALASLVLGLTIVGLAVYPEEYKTPDEVHAELKQKLDQAEAENFRSILSRFLPEPPESGFFLYLDAPKLGRTYNVLQKELAVALKTTIQEKQGERRAQISLKSVSGEAIQRKRIEDTVQMIPQAPTPERQAQWLIQSYKDLNLAMELPTSFSSEYQSYAATSAREALAERGVELTSQQLATLREGDAAVLATKLSKPNIPILYAGKLTLRAEGSTFRVTIKTGGGANVTLSGSGALSNLDDSMHACLREDDGCQIDGKILGIVWRETRKSTSIDLDVVPLAIW